jgi:rhodanese-related sulfurtransferase
MTETASDQTESTESCSYCPIAAGVSALGHWLVTRVPHGVRAAVLVCVALAAGAVYSAASPLGIPWLPSPGNRVGIPRAYESRLPEINAAEALKLYEAREALFVDSRDAKDYDEDHIPGALSIPMREWGKLWPKLKSKPPTDRLLVLYCYGSHCGLSTRQGKTLLENGYSKLVILDYGWAAWTKAGYPTRKHPKGAGS